MTFEMKFSQIDQCFRPKFENFVELGEPILIEGNFTENGEYNAINSGANGYDKVVVNVQPPLQDITITENGEYTANGENYGIRKAVVNVPPKADPRFYSLIDGTLTEMYDEEITELRQYALSYSPSLLKVCFLSANRFGSYCFRNSVKLQTIILPAARTWEVGWTTSCYSVTTIILNPSNVPPMYSTSPFGGKYHFEGIANSTYNPEGKKDGYLYVPLSLVADWRNATNWATAATQIMPWVSTVAELANIDGTTYDHACIWSGGEDFTEYYFNGTAWEVFIR